MAFFITTTIFITNLLSICTSLDPGIVQDLRENYTVPLLQRVKIQFQNTAGKLLNASKPSENCPCTYIADNDTRQDMHDLRKFVKSCTQELIGIKSMAFSDEDGNGTQQESETAKSVRQQIEFLKLRIEHMKKFLEKEHMRIEMLADAVLQLQTQPILSFTKHLKLRESILNTDPRGPRRKLYSHLIQQNRRRKLLARRISRNDICESFQTRFCSVQDLVVLEDDSYVASVKDSGIVLHKHTNGTTLGIFQSTLQLRGLSRLGRGNDVVVGSPAVRRAYVLRLIPDISIVREIQFDDTCPFGITEVESNIAVACANSIRLYDQNWNILREFPVENMTSGARGFSWLTYNPVSRLLLFSDSKSKTLRGINLDGNIIFTKESSWFPLKKPAGIAVSDDGTMYVVDHHQKRIVKYSVSGIFLGHIQNTIGLSVDITGNNTLVVGNYLSAVSEYTLY